MGQNWSAHERKLEVMDEMLSAWREERNPHLGVVEITLHLVDSVRLVTWL